MMIGSKQLERDIETSGVFVLAYQGLLTQIPDSHKDSTIIQINEIMLFGFAVFSVFLQLKDYKNDF